MEYNFNNPNTWGILAIYLATRLDPNVSFESIEEIDGHSDVTFWSIYDYIEKGSPVDAESGDDMILWGFYNPNAGTFWRIGEQPPRPYPEAPFALMEVLDGAMLNIHTNDPSLSFWVLDHDVDDPAVRPFPPQYDDLTIIQLKQKLEAEING